MSEPVDSVASFIAEQASAGSSSPGQFTLDAAKVREKLRVFQEEESCYYLLRAVQALIQAGATRLEFKFLRSSLSLSVPEKDLSFSPAELVRVFDDPSRWDDSALGNFAVALNACITFEPEGILWVQGEHETQFTEGEVRREPRPLEAALSARLEVKKQGRWFKSATAEEHLTIVKRLRHCGLPVTVDGYSLAEEWANHTAQELTSGTDPWYRGLSGPFLLYQGGDGPFEGYHQLAEGLFLRQDPEQGPFLCEEMESRVRLPLRLDGENRLYLVKHGVTIAEEKLDCRALGAEVVMDVEIPTDLSGLKAVRSPQREAAQNTAVSLVERSVETVEEHLEQLTFPTISIVSQTAESASRGLGNLAITFEGLVLGLPFWMVGSVGLLGVNAVRRWSKGDLHGFLRAELRKRLKGGA